MGDIGGDTGGHRDIMCTILKETWGDIGVLCAQPYRGHMGDI